MKRAKWIDFHLTSHPVLVTAPHAASEPGTGEMAEALSNKTGCSVVIGTVHRTEADLNRKGTTPAHHAFTWAVSSARPKVELSLHGMANSRECDIEVGTRKGRIASTPPYRKTMKCFRHFSREMLGVRRVVLAANVGFWGAEVLEDRPHDAIQVEFARWLRDEWRPELTAVMADLIDELSDER